MHRILNSLKSWTFWIPFAMFAVTMLSLRSAGVNVFITLAASITAQVVGFFVVAFVEVYHDAKKREKSLVKDETAS